MMSSIRTIEAWYGVPAEAPCIQLFATDSGPQWGEVRYVDGALTLEIFAQLGEAPLMLPVDELEAVLCKSREWLSKPVA